MGLRINTNIAALNANRQLNRTTARLNKSLERLSSGLMRWPALDDIVAAFLALSTIEMAGLGVVNRCLSPSFTSSILSGVAFLVDPCSELHKLEGECGSPADPGSGEAVGERLFVSHDG